MSYATSTTTNDKLSKLSSTIAERISNAATEDEALAAAIDGANEERDAIKNASNNVYKVDPPTADEQTQDANRSSADTSG